MAYDEKLVERIRNLLGGRDDVTEKKMFGGVAFMLDGKMFIGTAKNELMVRVGPERYEAALAEAHVRPMDFTGRPLTGYVYVSAEGYRTDRSLGKWIERAASFVATLPKPARAKKKPRTKPATKRRRASSR